LSADIRGSWSASVARPTARWSAYRTASSSLPTLSCFALLS